jgi:hypothetical protein
MRLALYTDYQYHRVDGEIRSERAFSIFVARIAEELGGLVLLGRLAAGETRGRYPVGESVEFVPLPDYRVSSARWRRCRAWAVRCIAPGRRWMPWMGYGCWARIPSPSRSPGSPPCEVSVLCWGFDRTSPATSVTGILAGPC